MTITIYHNPDCGISRNTLAMIRKSGEGPEMIAYLRNPPPRKMLVELTAAMGITPRELLREKAGVWERVFAALINDPNNDYISLDSSLVRAHQQAATGKGGGQKRGIRLWSVPEED